MTSPYDAISTPAANAPDPYDAISTLARPKRRRIGELEAGLSSLGDALTFSWGDELMGLAAGTGAALQGQDFTQAYNRQADISRTRLKQSWEDQPIAAVGGMLAGSVLPGVAAANAVRGIGTGVGLASRVAGAGIAGALGGAVSGAGAANESNRFEGAALGGALGAGLGAGLYTAGTAAGSALRKAVGSVSRATLPSGINEAAVNDLMRQARRSPGIYSPDDLRAALARAAEIDPSTTVAEAIGEPAIARAQYLSRMPGQTGASMAQRMQERADAAFGDIYGQAVERLSPKDPRDVTGTARLFDVDEARTVLADRLAKISEEGYGRALQQPLPTATRQTLDELRARAPTMFKEAERVADEIAQAEGISLATASPAKYYQLLRAGAADHINNLQAQGYRGARTQAFQGILRDYTTALEDALPGLKNARVNWRDAKVIQDEMAKAEKIFSARLPDVRAMVSKLSDEQRQLVKVGVLEQMRSALSRADKGGRSNIASALMSRERQNILREVFRDDPEQLDAFLSYVRNKRDLFESGRRMTASVGSPTSTMFFQALEGVGTPPTSFAQARQGLLEAAWRNSVGRIQEKSRDRLGQLYMMPVGTANDMASVASKAVRERGLLNRLRRRNYRVRATRDALATGLFAGQVGGGDE